MQIKPAIEKAATRGWDLGKPYQGNLISVDDIIDMTVEFETPFGTTFDVSIYKILLDPTFWEALGKAEVWEVIHDRGCPIDNERGSNECDCNVLNEWKQKQIDFIWNLQEGQDISTAFNNATS